MDYATTGYRILGLFSFFFLLMLEIVGCRCVRVGKGKERR